jgi:hypothetical protein
MLILPYTSPNETAFKQHVKLAKSQRIVLIVSLDALNQISTFSCEMIVAIDDLVSMPMASMIFAKDSPLQALFEYRWVELNLTVYL